MENLSLQYERWLGLIVWNVNMCTLTMVFILVVFQNEGLLHGYSFRGVRLGNTVFSEMDSCSDKVLAYFITDRKYRLVKFCHFITSVCFNRSERMIAWVRQTTIDVLGSEALNVSGKSDISFVAHVWHEIDYHVTDLNLLIVGWTGETCLDKYKSCKYRDSWICLLTLLM